MLLPLAVAVQGLAARALAGRVQAGLEAYNRQAADDMDQLLDVQRQLLAREQQLQAVVSGTVRLLADCCQYDTSPAVHAALLKLHHLRGAVGSLALPPFVNWFHHDEGPGG
jgi:hypothetical protein